jgi:hypothetical protein
MQKQEVKFGQAVRWKAYIRYVCGQYLSPPSKEQEVVSKATAAHYRWIREGSGMAPIDITNDDVFAVLNITNNLPPNASVAPILPHTTEELIMFLEACYSL